MILREYSNISSYAGYISLKIDTEILDHNY